MENANVLSHLILCGLKNGDAWNFPGGGAVSCPSVTFDAHRDFLTTKFVQNSSIAPFAARPCLLFGSSLPAHGVSFRPTPLSAFLVRSCFEIIGRPRVWRVGSYYPVVRFFSSRLWGGSRLPNQNNRSAIHAAVQIPINNPALRKALTGGGRNDRSAIRKKRTPEQEEPMRHTRSDPNT